MFSSKLVTISTSLHFGEVLALPWLCNYSKIGKNTDKNTRHIRVELAEFRIIHLRLAFSNHLDASSQTPRPSAPPHTPSSQRPRLTSGQFPSRPLGQRPLSGMCGCVQRVLQAVAHAADGGLRPGRDLWGQSRHHLIFFLNLVHV